MRAIASLISNLLLSTSHKHLAILNQNHFGGRTNLIAFNLFKVFDTPKNGMLLEDVENLALFFRAGKVAR